MSQVCQVTGKRPQVGNRVSHANRKTRRRFNINLHTKRFWLEDQKKYIKLKISAKGLRIIDKIGLAQALANVGRYQNDIVG